MHKLLLPPMSPLMPSWRRAVVSDSALLLLSHARRALLLLVLLLSADARRAAALASPKRTTRILSSDQDGMRGPLAHSVWMLRPAASKQQRVEIRVQDFSFSGARSARG